MTERTRPIIRTPDQRLRVFVSSTLQELASERAAVREAITRLGLSPVMFEISARPHPPRDLYRAYLEQSHIFIGIYWQRYGWIAPDEAISGLEDEYRLSGERPKLIYIKTLAPEREPRLQALLDQIKSDDIASYKSFATPDELRELVVNDLAVLLTERFEMAQPGAAVDDRAQSTRRDNLPTPPTPLINRAEERAELSALLQHEDTALVTLTGPAGTGKSRLGLQVASDLRAHFADGAFFVALATIRDPRLVIPTIAHTLDIREVVGDRPLVDRLYDYLRDKQTLLLLDNFEQVVAAASAIADLLSHCPEPKVLVTSRTPLHVRGEQEFPVAPLALPERMTLSEVERLAQSPAVALFVQCAQGVKPDFTLTAENAPIIAEICRQLDGLPLAIELTAARIKVLSPPALLARLTDAEGSRLELLTGGARDLPARQQTLRSTLDWSYELLDEGAKTLFRRLAVFDGGWMLEAAEAICNADSKLGADVLEELQVLHDMSLLTRRDMPDGEPRFNMLETIHEYALECLAHSDEGKDLRRRYAEYYLTLAERAEPELRSANRGRWLDRLEQEKDNLRAALAWSTSAEGDRHMGLRLAGALALFWRLRGYFGEGRHWLEALLAHRDSMARTRERARALEVAGTLAWAQVDLAVARALIEESLAIGRELNDQEIIAQALTSLGITLMTQGEPGSAHAHFQESVERFRAVHDEWGEADALSRLGNAVMLAGDFEQARSRYEESLAIFRKLGDPWGVAGVLAGLGGLGSAQGDAAIAQARYEEAVALLRQVGDRFSLAWAVSHLGFPVLFQGDVSRAQALFQEGLALGKEVDNPFVATLYLAGMAGIAALRSQTSQASSSEQPGADALRAARLSGAVGRLHREYGATFWHRLPLLYDRLLATARAQVDATAWDAAFAEGQAMSVDEALTYASVTDKAPT